jgi:hypothetical protein
MIGGARQVLTASVKNGVVIVALPRLWIVMVVSGKLKYARGVLKNERISHANVASHEARVSNHTYERPYAMRHNSRIPALSGIT